MLVFLFRALLNPSAVTSLMNWLFLGKRQHHLLWHHFKLFRHYRWQRLPEELEWQHPDLNRCFLEL